jgi:putative DNA primase/helicase
MQLTCDYNAIPDALRDLPQWVAWQPVVRDGRTTKVPINVRNSKLARTDHPEDWATLEEAVPYVRRHQRGLGFVFAAGGNKAGVDLDRCVDPATGRIGDWARFILWKLDSYAEISPSGTGVKIICAGTIPPGRRGWGDGNGMYDRLRFFTVTGQRLGDYPADVQDRADQLRELHGLLFPPADLWPCPATSPTTR